MNYIDKVKKLLNEELNMGSNYDLLLELYLLLVLIVGEKCTQQHVHDAWAVFENNIFPSHRSLVPFDELEKDVQELDEPYRIAIIKVAKMIGNKRS